MIIVCVRTFILYLVVLFSIRVMGKSELSKMSPFQMVVLFMIAELASIPIDSTTASLINGVVAILTLLVLQVGLSYFSLKNEKFKDLINGRPSILIEAGNLNIKELARLRININDLAEQLRLANCSCISDVEYAIMESNGDLSVIQKADKKPLTRADMGIVPNEEFLPLIVISDGYLYEKNLKLSGLDKEALKMRINACGIATIEEVFLAFTDDNQKLHIYGTPPKGYSFSQEVTI
ncbi:MAG: DUF421 domain-containing protein [Anaerovoracaceae bacterium]